MKTVNLLSPGQISENTVDLKQPPKKSKKNFAWLLLFIVFVLVPVYKIFYAPATKATKSEPVYHGEYHATEPVTPEEPTANKLAGPVEETTPAATLTESESSSSGEQLTPASANITSNTNTGSSQPAAEPVLPPKEITPPVQATDSAQEMIPVEEREYSLLFGSFSSPKEAKTKMEKVNESGANASVVNKREEQEAIVLYVGSFSDLTLAKETADCLRKDGFEIYLPKGATQPYKIRIGIYKKLSFAQKIEKKLADKGYETQIVNEKLPLFNYEVKTPVFQTYQEAKSQQNLLKESGVESILLLNRKTPSTQ